MLANTGPKNGKNIKCPNITRSRIFCADLEQKFEHFWKIKLTEEKIGPDNINHNKLRTYSTFKKNFSLEPYLGLVQNRSQRMLRISAHNLNIERGRYKGLAIVHRVCKYCQNEMNIDDELHFLNKCKTFLTRCNCFLWKIFLHISNF